MHVTFKSGREGGVTFTQFGSARAKSVLAMFMRVKYGKGLFVVGTSQVPINFCLALNIDWFNPYEETKYSV
jgi:hypothetical protein